MSKDSCGLFCCHPKCASNLADIRFFMVAICITSILQTSFSGYSASQATSLEHRFQVRSLVLGSIMATFEVGYIIAVIVLSFFTKRLHVPKLVGISLVGLSIGAFIWASSNFIFTSVAPEELNTTVNICDPNEASFFKSTISKYNPFIGYVVIGQMLIGIGSSPMMTFAPPFIDDHVSKDLAPPLIACVYTFAAVGVIFGYGVGALMIQMPRIFPQYFKLRKSNDFNEAWWLGYLILGTMDLILGIFMFMFPRNLKKVGRSKSNFIEDSFKIQDVNISNKSELEMIQRTSHCENLLQNNSNLVDSQKEDNKFSFQGICQEKISTIKSKISSSMNKYEVETFQSFLVMLKKLIFNKTYMLATIGMCLEMFNMVGFGYFAPKFFETVFQIDKFNASISVGIILVPSGAIGIVLGGLLIKQFKWTSRATSMFILLLSSICLIFVLILLAFTCPNVLISGVNTDTFSGDESSLINSCNSDCNCKGKQYSPVCYTEKGISFVSPCHAGCQNIIYDPVSNQRSYSDCKCLVQGINTTSVTINEGICKNACNSKTVYLIIISIGLLLCGMVQNPLVMITMRSVDLDSRTFALSYQFIVLRLFSYIPSPPLYGMIFDSSCLVKKSKESGFCNFVDAKTLNTRIIWLFASVKIAAFITYIILYISLTCDEKKYGKCLLTTQVYETDSRLKSKLNTKTEIEIDSNEDLS